MSQFEVPVALRVPTAIWDSLIEIFESKLGPADRSVAGEATWGPPSDQLKFIEGHGGTGAEAFLHTSDANTFKHLLHRLTVELHLPVKQTGQFKEHYHRPQHGIKSEDIVYFSVYLESVHVALRFREESERSEYAGEPKEAFFLKVATPDSVGVIHNPNYPG